MEFVERAVLAVVAERRLAADDGRGKPGGDRQRAGRLRVAADRAAIAIDQRHRDVLGAASRPITSSATVVSEIPMAHMPRNAPSCRIGSAAGITVRGATRLATCAPSANSLVSRTRRKISRSAKADADRGTAALEQRATPCGVGDAAADEYSLGNFSRTLAEIGLAAVDVGRRGIRVGAAPHRVSRRRRPSSRRREPSISSR